MTPRSIVLASSPVVGPLVMERLAAALRERGTSVVTPVAHTDVDEYVDAAVVGCRSVSQPMTLVGFSAGGPRLLAIAARTQPEAIVFMDAGIPAHGKAPDADPAMAALLERLPIDADGLLPAWPEWWPEGVLERLCPDPDLRRRLIEECRPVPRAMYSEPVPAPPFAGPCGFLAFGDGYADQRAEAERRGWSVSTIDASHLAPLVAPDTVAIALLDLIDVLDRAGAR